jgi:hypothetical protein
LKVNVSRKSQCAENIYFGFHVSKARRLKRRSYKKAATPWQSDFQQASAGAHLRAVQGVSSNAKDRVKNTDSRIEIYGSFQSIQRAIFAIETATPYLCIANAVMKIMPAEARTQRPTGPVMQAQLDIFGPIQIKRPDP